MDVRALQAALRQLGLRLPHGLIPGNCPGGLVDVAADEASWTAYRWNPPEYMRNGAVYRIGPWRGPRRVAHLRTPDGRFDAFAYRNANEPPALPAATAAGVLPEGWSAWPARFPAFSIARRIRRVPADIAIDAPDPEASPKPAWAALVEAARTARLGRLPAALIARANAEAKARIAIAYAGTPDRIEEAIRRLNGRASPAQDAERARLVAVCHGLEARIRAARTIEALEAIDVASDAAWAARDDGNKGGE